MMTKPEIRRIPYIRSDGKENAATIIPVEFSAEGLSQEEMTALSLLSKAVDAMTPLYAQLQSDRTVEFYRALEDLERKLQNPEVRRKVADFNELAAIRNSPWDAYGYGFRFPIPREEIPADHPLQQFADLLYSDVRAPQGRGFYPTDITEEEFSSLPKEDQEKTNSTIIRGSDGKIQVVLNEERFRADFARMIAPLEQMLAKPNVSQEFRDYLSAEIEFFRTGSQQAKDARDEAQARSIKAGTSLDFFIDYFVHPYFDGYKSFRGLPHGMLSRPNKRYEDIATKFIELLPELEAAAPWTHKKQIAPENVPKFKYLDVANWGGMFDLFPSYLPGEKLDVTDDYAVSLMFINMRESMDAVGAGSYVFEEFFPRSAQGRRNPRIGIQRDALHELGHASGGVVFEKDVEKVEKHFGKDYTIVEETRAESFSLWAMPMLIQRGMFKPEDEITAHYSMLRLMIGSMKQKPVGHNGSRNLMFYWMLKHGGIVEVEEDGKTKYAINLEKARPAVAALMAEMADIRAEGNLERIQRLKDEYISDAQREMFERRLAGMPQGAGFIYPTLEKVNGVYTGKVVYPQTFRDQPRSLRHFI